MQDFRIYPLMTGMTIRPKAAVSYGVNKEEPVECPVIAYYVTDGNLKILVDTGGEPATGNNHAPYYQEESWFIEKQLKKLGVKCEDINIVILTHLHWDHADNLYLFPQAMVYVQKEELRYAACPLAIHLGLYNQERIFSRSYNVLDGDAKITDNISVILTPGHSPGSQTILVKTISGDYALTGDLVNNMDNWNSEPKRINGLHTDVSAYYASYSKLARSCSQILAGHDMRVFEKKMYI